MPETFLTQILLKLKSGGLVQSVRGSSGGYRLARPPDQIMLDEILKVVDGYDFNLRDLQGPASVPLAEVWSQVWESQVKILSNTSIADLAEKMSPPDWVI
jgi:Rrf2 family protein